MSTDDTARVHTLFACERCGRGTRGRDARLILSANGLDGYQLVCPACDEAERAQTRSPAERSEPA